MALAALFAGGGPRLPPGSSSSITPKPKPATAKILRDEIETASELQEAIGLSAAGNGKLVIIAFVASFAPPCEVVVADLKKLKGSVKTFEVFTVDAASPKGSVLADAAGIEATPTLRFFVKGKQVHTMTTVDMSNLIFPFVIKWSKKAQK